MNNAELIAAGSPIPARIVELTNRALLPRETS
jgi:hypothetical protein